MIDYIIPVDSHHCFLSPNAGCRSLVRVTHFTHFEIDFSSHVDDFNTRNKVLTAKLLRQGYRYHKLRKAFSKFYRRHFDIAVLQLGSE